jgi:hypothetical protein
MNRKVVPIPEAIAQLQRQLEQFRSTQSGRGKIPEPLWQAATELARRHGVHAVAQPLRLDYMRLKQRLNGAVSPQERPSTMAFVELVSPHTAKLEEWAIEFESANGGKMRIQCKGTASPDWNSLLRAWRQVEG